MDVVPLQGWMSTLGTPRSIVPKVYCKASGLLCTVFHEYAVFVQIIDRNNVRIFRIFFWKFFDLEFRVYSQNSID